MSSRGRRPTARERKRDRTRAIQRERRDLADPLAALRRYLPGVWSWHISHPVDGTLTRRWGCGTLTIARVTRDPWAGDAVSWWEATNAGRHEATADTLATLCADVRVHLGWPLT